MIRSRNARSAAVLGVAAAVLLSGCGRSEEKSASAPSSVSTAAPKGTVTIWAQGTEGEALPALLKDFEKANPGVRVKVTPVPWDNAQDKYRTAVAGNTTPDIGMLGSDWMPSFRSSLEPVPSDIDTSGMYPGSVQSVTFDEQRYGVPWYVDTRVIFYRSDLMKQAGFDAFPTTQQGFHDLAAALKSKGGAKYGVNLPASGWNSFLSVLPFAWSNGAQLTGSGDSTWTINTPEVVKTFSYLKTFFDEGLANKNTNGAATPESQLVDGSVPMMISGPWMIGVLQKAGGAGFSDKFAVAPIPGDKSSSLISGADLVVFKGSKNKDAAWRLLQWLNKPEIQVKWFQATGDLPSQKAAWSDPALSADPKVAAFAQQLQNVVVLPMAATWPQVSAAADSAYEQVMKGTKEPAKALAEVQSKAESLGMGAAK